MCNKLFQLYACSHAKEICTTPCPYAQTAAITTNLSRSNSVASSIAPSLSSSSSVAAKRSVVYTSPTQRSPLRVVNPDVDIATEAPSPAFGWSIPTCHHDAHPNAQAQHTQSSTMPSRCPTPASSSAASNSTSPTAHSATSNHSTDPATTAAATESNLCVYFFPPRFLPPSRFPCLDCYMLPQWEGMRRAWMENYRNGHPMDGLGDTERLSGVKGVRLRNRMRGCE